MTDKLRDEFVNELRVLIPTLEQLQYHTALGAVMGVICKRVGSEGLVAIAVRAALFIEATNPKAAKGTDT